MSRKSILITSLFLLLLLPALSAFAQKDTRYASDMNLPFNDKAGDYNPQTGDVTLSAADVSLPGRAGYNFSFGRVWNSNQAMAFNMYYKDGENRLNSNTIERISRLGVGWRSSLPYLMFTKPEELSQDQDTTLNLFYGGGVYEVDKLGIAHPNTKQSNLVGYDLLDLRLYEDGSVSYASFGTSELAALKSAFSSITDIGTDTCQYVLILKTKEKYFFRADGQLMMQQDRTGLNRIWYFYESDGGTGKRLKAVVDTIGRRIRFDYNAQGLVSSVNWTVSYGKKNGETRAWVENETRSVTYEYTSAETSFYTPGFWTEWSTERVLGYKTPYLLTAVKDEVDRAIGTETRYEYSPGLVSFTYNKFSSQDGQNLYALLTGVSGRDNGTKYLSKRVLEWDKREQNPYLKTFYSGYFEYYKLARQYVLDRHAREMNKSTYAYFEEGENGNFGQYQTVVHLKGSTATYTYALGSDQDSNHVLKKLEAKTTDGFLQLTVNDYYPNRTKKSAAVYRGGNWVYAESYRYDEKGNPVYTKDKMGLETSTTFHPDYSVPLDQVRTFSDASGAKEYRTRNEVDNATGQITAQFMYLRQPNGSLREVRAAKLEYDTYGNLVSQTDAAGNKSHTVFDSTYQAFPVKVWQKVSIQDWSAKTDPEWWTDDPDITTNCIIRSWKVFNTDGTLWVEVDNEGFALEHYYDKSGTEVETVNPDLGDYRDFAQKIPAVETSSNEWAPDPGATDFDDFRLSAAFSQFLSTRQDNPGARMTIYYQDAFVMTEADIDKAAGTKKKSGVQQDGLGNTETEMEFSSAGTETHALTGLTIYAKKTMTYDDRGRMIAMTDADAGPSYVTDERYGTSFEKHDKTWVVEYDELGRKTKTLYPRTEAKALPASKVVRYNDSLNTTEVTNENGQTAVETRDWNGNTVKVEAQGDYKTPAADKQTYTYAYDQLNRKVRFTDSQGIVTQYYYDERNLLVREEYFEAGIGSASGSDFMVYDDLGRLVKRTDRKNQSQEFTYDELGRNTLLEHYLPDGSKAYEVKTVYDNRGNAIRINNQNLIEYYEYDFANRVICLKRKLASGLDPIAARLAGQTWFTGAMWGTNPAKQVFSFKYAYNDAGMVTKMTYPDGSEHAFEYDAQLARLTKLREGQGTGGAAPGSFADFVSSLSYTKAGVVTEMDYANNTKQAWDFDNRKRISHIRITGPSQAVLEDLTYRVDGAGNILSINQNEYAYDGFNRIVGAKTMIPGGANGAADPRKLVAGSYGTYQGLAPIVVDGTERTYDPAADLNHDGRVNGLDHIMGSFTNDQEIYDIESFVYDKNGNRTKLVQNADEYTYEYGVRNRLLKVYKKKPADTAKKLFIEYEYDANGNTTKRTIHKETVNEVVTFEYDTLNRVTTSTEGGKWTSYRYDNAGNRFIKEGSDGSLSLYLRHGQIAVAMDVELPATTETAYKGKLNRYVLSGDLLAGRVTLTAAQDNSVTFAKSWYHLDHLNSTKCVTDSNGVVEVSYTYRAFGEQLKRLDAAGNETDDKAKYSYGGKELDENTNLYYFNARYYDATIGRFISVDPVQDGSNWYVYCANNPLSLKDPTGLEGQPDISSDWTTPTSTWVAIQIPIQTERKGEAQEIIGIMTVCAEKQTWYRGKKVLASDYTGKYWYQLSVDSNIDMVGELSINSSPKKNNALGEPMTASISFSFRGVISKKESSLAVLGAILKSGMTSLPNGCEWPEALKQIYEGFDQANSLHDALDAANKTINGSIYKVYGDLTFDENSASAIGVSSLSDLQKGIIDKQPLLPLRPSFKRISGGPGNVFDFEDKGSKKQIEHKHE